MIIWLNSCDDSLRRTWQRARSVVYAPHEKGQLLILGVRPLALIVPIAFNMKHTPMQGRSRLRWRKRSPEAVEDVLRDDGLKDLQTTVDRVIATGSREFAPECLTVRG